MNDGWTGVDLDGTLAVDDMPSGVYEPRHIGRPIPEMVNRVKAWLAAGEDVRIFTARVSGSRNGGVTPEESRMLIEVWCKTVFGRILPITCIKDFKMKALWDDRAIQVEKNTGRRIGNHERI